MKLGTVIVIFKENWQEIYAPLLKQGFDHYELVPENQSAYSTNDLRTYFKDREIIIHAPFAQANLIAPSRHIRRASRQYLTDVLAPIVEDFDPQVITTHLGSVGSFYKTVELDQFIRLSKSFSQITIENLPESPAYWRASYPRNEKQLDYVIKLTNCNITFDVGHWGRQGYDVYSIFEKYIHRIRDIHLHDYKKGTDHLPLGAGELDLKRFITMLLNHQYEHYLTLELGFENTNVTIESYQKVKKLLSLQT